MEKQRELNSLVNTVYAFSDDIGMKFGIDKCNIIIMRRGKKIEGYGMIFEVMKRIEKTGYKYVEIIQ